MLTRLAPGSSSSRTLVHHRRHCSRRAHVWSARSTRHLHADSAVALPRPALVADRGVESAVPGPSGSNMSVSYVVDIASLILRGPHATMIVGAASGWSRSTLNAQGPKPPYRIPEKSSRPTSRSEGDSRIGRQQNLISSRSDVEGDRSDRSRAAESRRPDQSDGDSGRPDFPARQRQLDAHRDDAAITERVAQPAWARSAALRNAALDAVSLTSPQRHGAQSAKKPFSL